MSAPFDWTGRDDGAGPQHTRWHDVVRLATAGEGPPGGLAIVGFASDEGVRRNQGRTGAAAGPAALRRSLADLAVPAGSRITDAGTVTAAGTELESAQAQLGAAVATLADRHDIVVVLGGGQEVSWGSYLGRAASSRLRDADVGVVNLDAHLDLRTADRPTSGTPFLQMAQADRGCGHRFDYTVIGAAGAANTAALFETAAVLGARIVRDVDCGCEPSGELLAHLDAVAARNDAVHLSIDLDVLPASVAPGVSAPAAYGVPLRFVEQVCRHLVRSGKVAIVDLVELNPAYDVDDRTARTAARLVHSIHAEATRSTT